MESVIRALSFTGHNKRKYWLSCEWDSRADRLALALRKEIGGHCAIIELIGLLDVPAVRIFMKSTRYKVLE
jgi:hypothetical protein